MGQCCTIQQSPRSQRRINGLQLPLHFQQVIGWVVFLATALLNFIILIQIQFNELKIVSLCIYCVLYVMHIVSHALALLTDPSERNLRKMKLNTVPEFDRSVHAHVIENGRCHLCNIDTSGRKTKHCSICNKCVDHFDHHCKWLNNCIGQRNYAPFITCVTSALLISIYTSSLCLTDVILFLAYPQKLSMGAQNFINCTSVMESPYTKYCRNSITFLTFLIIFSISALGIACALLHLCCFHVYISILGVSTYEYIVKGDPTENSLTACNKNGTCCTVNIAKYKMNKTKEGATYHHKNAVNEFENGPNETDMQTWKVTRTSDLSNEPNVTNIIGIIFNDEINRAKKIFLYDRNKIHPQNESSGS